MLAGKRVLVTRAKEQAGSLAALLAERGASPVVFPTILIAPPTDPEPLARAVRDLARYDWVAFTSANAVLHTFAELERQGRGAAAFSGLKVAAVGPATAKSLAEKKVVVDVLAKEARGEGLAREILSRIAAPVRVLVPRAREGREALPDALRGAGCVVDVVTAYETVRPSAEKVEELRGALAARTIDAVTFTSGSTVEHLFELLGPAAAELLGALTIASIGPVTTEAAKARGLRVAATACEATIEELVGALERAFAAR